MSKDLNILYDNQIFVQQRYGGIPRLFYELIKHLSQREGVNVILFQGFHVNHFPLADLRDRMAFYFGKRIRPLPYTAKILRVFNTVLFDLFKPHKKIDIFHPTDYSPVVYRWKKTPLLLTVYDMIFELFPHYFKDLKTRIEKKKKCIARADMIIAISNATKNDLMKFYDVDEKKVKVVYPGAPSRIEPGKDKYNEEKNVFPGQRPFILYVGTRKRKYKNFKNLLLAYASGNAVNGEFDLVCFGGPPFTKSEWTLISTLGQQNRVFQLSGDDALLARLYSSAALFVYPSLYEGFGLPPLEAMGYHCPVVASNTSSIPEVLGEAAFYFNPHDPESISAAMEKVLLEDGLANELSKKGSVQVKKYSWAKMAEETYQLYRGLINPGTKEV